MKHALAIGSLECLLFLIVTINFRACAKGKLFITLSTDALIAASTFTLTRMIVDAKTTEDQIAYVLGAVLGSFLGMRLTRRWDTA